MMGHLVVEAGCPFDTFAMPTPSSVSQRPSRKRAIGLAALAALLLCAAFAYRSFRGHKPIGTGPAGPTVERAAFARPWTTRPVLLLGLGDSITAGFGATPQHSYFERLVTNPGDEFPDMKGICLKTVLPHLRVKNRSVSGSTSLEHLESQINRLETVDTGTLGLVVITTGGNDLIHNYGRTPPREGAMYGATMAQARPWVAAFAARLDIMINRIQKRFPGGCHIFLANIYDPTDGVGDIENAGLPPWPDGLAILDAYNTTLARCAQKHAAVHLVNIHDEFLGHGIHCREFWAKHYDAADPGYWYYENLEDPNDRGYDAIRRLFLIEMAKVAGAGIEKVQR